ncbi:hypothetical protein D3C87_1619660 [compost metagenome]
MPSRFSPACRPVTVAVVRMVAGVARSNDSSLLLAVSTKTSPATTTGGGGVTTTSSWSLPPPQADRVMATAETSSSLAYGKVGSGDMVVVPIE